jgi:ornithine carbamoyltransferase
MKHLLKLLDLSTEDIFMLIDAADRMKHEHRRGVSHPLLRGKTLGMIFQKSSTRTRVSFEVGMFQLGGHAMFLNARDLQMGRGEPVADTARVLSRYVDGIMIRTYSHQEVEELAGYAAVPVINGLTDFAHPCQVLADLMTIRELKGRLEGLKVCYIGDGNNMANSLTVGCLKAGMQVALACPVHYAPHPSVLAFAAGKPFAITQCPTDAARDADVLITDVWASMGQEDEQEDRAKAFGGYQINETLLGVAKPGCIVQHCLPAHRGEEITAEVFENHAEEIFTEAENRLHVQKAILASLMG